MSLLDDPEGLAANLIGAANLVLTKKNGPLVSLFAELPFKVVEENSESVAYVIEDLTEVPDEAIVEIVSPTDHPSRK